MIPIKFRGKRIDNGEWVYGYLRRTPRIAAEIYSRNLGGTFEVHLDTVGQDTGLKDKNDNEGYKGDLFIHQDRNTDGEIEIIWHDGGWHGQYVDTDFVFPLNKYEMSKARIIGNIHEQKGGNDE